MKIRTDFVSNSSSSSFILGENKLFDYYGIILQDICAAVDALGGGEGFKEHYEAYSLPEDYAKADESLGRLLQCWNQTVPHTRRYTHFYGVDEGMNVELFEKFLDALNNAYHCYLFQGSDEDLGYERIPENVKVVVKDVRSRLEVETARDVLKRDNAKCVFHFDDNYIWDLAGVNEDDPQKWRTESYTVERVFEVILAKLVEMGKIKLNDKEVLSKLYPACGKSSGETCILDEKYDAEEFIEESCLHFVAHEG